MSGPESKSEVFTIVDAEMGEPHAERGTSTTIKKSCTIFEQYVQPCLTELLGTTLFVFVGCSSVLGNTTPGVIQPAVAHGLALAVMIKVFGQISGGHFNPAVSLSVYLCGGMELPLLGPYVLAQMLGGISGACLAKAIYPSSMYTTFHGGAFNAVIVSSDLVGATSAEVIMTLILTMVVCMGAVNSRTRSQWAPFCIGLAVTANILAGGLISGACMNPARAFGPAVAANHWKYHWVYWVGPSCGALLCASFIRLLFGDQKTRVVLK